eukprot:7879466-Alexandrium_andersonii.AAC.1
MHDAMLTHMAAINGYDLELPKHHLLLHLIHSTGWAGNPRVYATWTDESENRRLKAVCKGAHQLGFEATVLNKMRDSLALSGKRKPEFQ